MGQNVQLYLVLIVFAFSALSWAWNKFREYKQVQEVREATRRRREEELRTGRAAPPTASVGTPVAARTPNLEELAAKRQAQLEELRARQQAKSRPGQKPTPAARAASVPTPARRTLATPPSPRGPAPAKAPPRGRPVPPAPQAPARGRGTPKPPVRPPVVIGRPPAPVGRPAPGTRPAPRPAPRPTLIIQEEPEVVRPTLRSQHVEQVHEQLKVAPMRELLGSVNSLRQAIVLSEILAPPVSMR